LLPAPRTAPGTGTAFAQRLARLPEAERGARVLALVREEAARALGLPGPDPVRPDEPLRDLGMDSVTAVDLRNRIGARVGARLPATLLFDHPTPARLTPPPTGAPASSPPGPGPPPRAPRPPPAPRPPTNPSPWWARPAGCPAVPTTRSPCGGCSPRAGTRSDRSRPGAGTWSRCTTP